MCLNLQKVRAFFKRKGHIKLFLKPLGFGEKEFAALQTIAEPKRKYAYNWYYNNLWFPLSFSILIPVVLSAFHDWFGVIPYNKCFLEILISGSLSLSGLNILRSTSTMITTGLDDSQLSEPIKKLWAVIKDDMYIIKNKLEIAINSLTILGFFAYLVQVSQIINGNNNAIYICIFFFILIFVYSIIVGKLIFNSNANYLKDEQVVKVLFTTISGESFDRQNLADQVSQGGL